jgi:hypothetical protein
LSKTIEFIDFDYGQEIKVTDGNTVTQIRVDEENPYYQELKAETNNFTENMVQKTEQETLQQTQIDLIFQLMLNGVI